MGWQSHCGHSEGVATFALGGTNIHAYNVLPNPDGSLTLSPNVNLFGSPDVNVNPYHPNGMASTGNLTYFTYTPLTYTEEQGGIGVIYHTQKGEPLGPGKRFKMDLAPPGGPFAGLRLVGNYLCAFNLPTAKKGKVVVIGYDHPNDIADPPDAPSPDPPSASASASYE